MIHPKDFETRIGFNQIKELLSYRCLSAMGKEEVEKMSFMEDPEKILDALDKTREFMGIQKEDEDFPTDHFFDLREPVSRLRLVGLFMEEQELFDLMRFLFTLEAIVKRLSRTLPESRPGQLPVKTYPHLGSLADGVETFRPLRDQISKTLDAYGKIKDSASEKLAQIRHELSRTTGTISSILQGILRQAQSQGVVEKDVTPTMRDGRLVIPVAPSMKRQIKGIVHDESATGKTVFIEPAQVVEANNRIRELEAEERREIIRILLSFSEIIRPDIKSLLDAFRFIGQIDFIRAKARLALSTASIVPVIKAEPCLDWVQAVHPLLQISLDQHGKKAVPLDIRLDKDGRILLISGPNAGGKSVCLKTVGLLQYMLQAGMPIPVRENSTAGLFQGIFMDIGDQQSIEDELSTYSSHLENMKLLLKKANERSLILIDEFGGGTEPRIGGAIAQAVLDRLNQKGAWGVITTHFHNLKEFAEATEGVRNAAMLYDRGQMQPLFILQIGNPGSSFAVEIARKIGLPEDVIQEATQIVGSDYVNLDKYLQDIVRDKRYWENKRQGILQKEKKMDAAIQEYEKDLEELRAKRKDILSSAREQAEQVLSEANARIEGTIRQIKEAQAEKEATRQIRSQLKEFKENLEDLENAQTQMEVEKKIQQLLERKKRKAQNREKKLQQAKQEKEQALKRQMEKEEMERTAIKEGSRVLIKGQSTVGTVLKIEGGDTLVAFGGLKTHVPLARLVHATKQEEDRQPMRKDTFLSSQTMDDMHERRLNFRQEIDLRGMRADEALQAVSYYIDDAILVGVSRVRLLHGTGGGILRSIIRDYLSTVPQIARYHDEHVQLGGAGITVVEFEDA